MGDLPLYLRIKQDLKTAIDRGEYPEGTRVPSEFELAKQYNVSRNPTRQALRELELEGYLSRSRRRGSFVTPASYRTRRLSVVQGRVVAIICPHGKSAHSRGIVEAFVHRMGERGSHVMVYFMECTDRTQSELLEEIRQSGIAGVALWLSDDCTHVLEVLGNFYSANYPFVLVDRYVRNKPWDYVVTDNEQMGYVMTKVLIARGHTSIGFMSNVFKNTANDERFAGYRRALDEAGLPFNEGLIAQLPEDKSAAPTEIHKVIAQKNRPTAFFCAQDWIALKSAEVFNFLGYSVPNDIELAAVDDGELANITEPKVFSASQLSEEIGVNTAEVLMNRIELPQSGPTQRLIAPLFNFDLPA